MPNAFYYSNTAQQTTLTGSISAGGTSIQVSATTGFPVSFPYVLAVDFGAATEELVSVTAAAGTTLTVTRGYGGTSAQSHSIGAVVRHVYNAQDATDFRAHEAATAAVHGVAGTLVGTSDTQTLANKTLTNPTINGATMTGTIAGTRTYTGTVTHSGTLTSSGGTISGSWAGNPTFSGNPIFSGNVSIDNKLSQTGLASNSIMQGSLVTGDVFDRFRRYADGLHEWGSGSSNRDTTLLRSGTKTLQTGNTFNITPTDTSLDGLQVNLPASTAGDLLNLRVNSAIQAAMGSDGAFRIYSGNSPTSFTPSWGNTGGASFSTNSGFYFKIGKMVFVHLHTIVSGAGSGSGIVSVNMPSVVDGTIRQVLTLHGETVGVNGNATGTIRGGECVKFAGSNSATMDRLRVDSASSPVAREDNILGADLIVGATLTIQGWYREA